jgi:hypothetical protein
MLRNVAAHLDVHPEPLRRLSDALTESIYPDEARQHDKGDLNPLGPCGSCMEWLKKVAEVNPDFKARIHECTSWLDCS